MECDKLGIRVRLVTHNNALPVVISAIKTSAGKVKEKGLDYYLNEYLKKKPDKAWEWIKDAYRKYPSVLEHWVITVFIDGCSRSCTHQLVRHRLASYTQESQRYSVSFALSLVPSEFVEVGRKYFSDEEKAKLFGFIEWMKVIKKNASALLYLSDVDERVSEKVIEPIKKIVVIPPTIEGRELLEFAVTIIDSLKKYAELVLSGVPYEDARYVLPNAMRSRIMVTANLREWLHIIKLRTSPHAQWEIRCVMTLVRRELEKVVPVISELV
jgi:thymidylate synthase (FAD)